MEYELAKKLKESGFPWNIKEQVKLDIVCAQCPMSIEKGILHTKACGGIYRPSLSELIEACGENFGSLVQYHISQEMWSANAYEKELNCNGKTPEEAVANLWIGLTNPL